MIDVGKQLEKCLNAKMLKSLYPQWLMHDAVRKINLISHNVFHVIHLFYRINYNLSNKRLQCNQKHTNYANIHIKSNICIKFTAMNI